MPGMTSAAPNVCVIGAGVSGLTACKALDDFGVPAHAASRPPTRSAATGTSRTPTASPRPTARCTSTSPSRRSPSATSRCPIAIPDYPHHTHIFEWLRDYADAFDAARATSASTRACSAPSAARRAAGRITLDDGASESFDALLVCNGHHWDPRCPTFPGTLRRPADPLARLRRPEQPARPQRQARARRRDRQQRGGHRLRARRARRCARSVFLSTRSGAYVVPKYLFGKPADQVVKTNPRLPAKLQRRMARLLPRIFSGRMEDFGLPTPNHNFLDAHPTVSSELLGRLGAGDAVAKGDVAELLGDRVRFADGSVEHGRRDHLRDRLQRQLPVLRPGLPERARKTCCRCTSGCSSPGIDDLAFIGLGQPIPTIFPFSELQSKLAARWLSGDWAPPPIERDGARDRRRRGLPHGPLHRQAPPHDAARVVRLQARARTRARSPPGRPARAPARRRVATPPDARAGARRRRRWPHERGLVRQRRRALRRRAPARRGRCLRRAQDGGAPASCSPTASPGTVDSGLLPFAERFAAAGLDALAFDYRHFGASDGEPRQLLSIPRQLEDYAAAIAFARTLPGVDPARIVRVGLLLLRRARRGGRGRRRARRRRRSRRCPAMDGAATLINLAALRRARRSAEPLTLAGLRDSLGSLRGAPAGDCCPSSARPGSLAAMTTPDAEPGYRAITGPTWRNEVAARIGLTAGALPPRAAGRPPALPDPHPDRRPRRDRSGQGRAGRRLAGDRARRGADLPDRSFRHLPRRAVRAGRSPTSCTS